MKYKKTIPEKIIDLLSDMRPHGRKELLALLEDDQAEVNALHQHIHKAKPLALKMDKEIICQVVGRLHYYRMIWDTDTSPRELIK